MGAFNYIRICGECPVCKTDALILCQTHIASDYDGNLEVGRFHDHTYELGERMPWFEDDTDSWYVYDEYKVGKNEAQEACHSTCQSCGADIYTLIYFENITPTKVLKIGLEKDMPEKYR
jgi:hypothetical protein